MTQLALPVTATVGDAAVTYRMVFPWLPPSKNRYDGWLPAWQASAKRKWIAAITREADAQQIPAVSRVAVAVELVFASRARRDPQNYAQAIWNWVPDGLVRAGVIPDDGEGRILIGEHWGVVMRVGAQRRTVVDVTAPA